MKSGAARRWAAVLLYSMAAFASVALADDPNPTALHVTAPELVGGEWRNTRANAPLTLASERGKVTILHFWTFG